MADLPWIVQIVTLVAVLLILCFFVAVIVYVARIASTTIHVVRDVKKVVHGVETVITKVAMADGDRILKELQDLSNDLENDSSH